ncbi:hypothetical protein AV530_008518 [Patagioenas fasciata monilis]|uniref:Uncharacterized protein n=1 Tax=Patagioenas fasciata monilis TaxID=372326 RepID=A0A1V4KCF6_PATFA|nr:hypothetical protein AV530_008518 [Patagioenas fasciata monilis]
MINAVAGNRSLMSWLDCSKLSQKVQTQEIVPDSSQPTDPHDEWDRLFHSDKFVSKQHKEGGALYFL